jgi:pyruvate kinase
MNTKIICTLGPSSFKRTILDKLKKLDVNIFRINMSHTSLVDLEKLIKYLKKNKVKNICIDTEGAQIRTTKVNKKFFLKKNRLIKISTNNYFSNDKVINLYPKINLKEFKNNSLIYIGFDNLILKVKKKASNKDTIIAKVINAGLLESNKGVHTTNEISLNSLTDKDIKAIKIAKKYKIKHYAMSFVNKGNDVYYLRSLLKENSIIISKIETLNALKNLSNISNQSDALLIDRGDLSRYISIDRIPAIQEGIAKFAKKKKVPLYVATNLLETMIKESNPTRAESHDIYSTLNQGVRGLVLAAETAIGKDPVECVRFLKKCIKNFDQKTIKQIQSIIK